MSSHALGQYWIDGVAAGSFAATETDIPATAESDNDGSPSTSRLDPDLFT